LAAGGLLATFVLAPLVEARTATLRSLARLRSGPSATTELLTLLPVGTTVEIVGQVEGWHRVRTSEGRTGYILAEHVGESDAAPSGPEPTRRSDAPRSLADDVAQMRAEVNALRDRQEPATAGDVRRLRTEIKRLASAQRALARRFDDRILPTALDPGPEGSAGFAPVWLVLGGIIGWGASRFVQRRRDRRQRTRLRL
jgi:hypothetical protein